MAEIIRRSIFNEVEEHFSQKQVTVISGIRRSGKTTLLKHLCDKVDGINKIFIDLENIENRQIFKQLNYDNIYKSFMSMGLSSSSKAYVFMDEIHLVPNIASIMKYLYDHYNIKFIVTGSSSFYLKDLFSESLSGRKKIFIMNTLNFREFLKFKKMQFNLPSNREYFNEVVYNKLSFEYGEFLNFGGFPEVTLAENEQRKLDLLSDILNSYFSMDIKFLSDFEKRDELYNVVKLLASRTGSKTDFTKLSNICGINRKKIKEYLLFFEQTFLIKQVSAFTKNADREVALQKKIYFTDNGLLRALGIRELSKLLENAIFNQLSAKGTVNYYSLYTGQEIDFILDGNTSFEVKETPSAADLNVLKKRSDSIGIKKYYLIGFKQSNPSFDNFIWAGSIY